MEGARQQLPTHESWNTGFRPNDLTASCILGFVNPLGVRERFGLVAVDERRVNGADAMDGIVGTLVAIYEGRKNGQEGEKRGRWIRLKGSERTMIFWSFRWNGNDATNSPAKGKWGQKS